MSSQIVRSCRMVDNRAAPIAVDVAPGGLEPAWRPRSHGPQSGGREAVAREVGEGLRDPSAFARAIEAAPAQSTFPEYGAWRPTELAQSHPGPAMTFVQVDACFPDEE
jgi:hypothetical protein